MTYVPRGTKTCSCGRPRVPGQRKCSVCRAEYMRVYRRDKVSMDLTQEEAQLIRQLRAGRSAETGVRTYVKSAQ